MSAILLTLLIVVSAALHLRAEYLGPANQVYLFKPLTTSLIILLALTRPEPPTSFYKMAILAGLLFSLAGDVFLMLPSDRFLLGLISFLVAHLAYIVAFSSVTGFYRSWWALLPFLIYGLLIIIYLWPGLGQMAIPAFIYMLVILVMAWQALGQWRQTGDTRALLAFAGALFFVISDSALAINRFRQPFETGRLVVLSTYYLAQWLIALSVSGRFFLNR
jgi:uncharacterized membrane protein YhhN